MCKLKATLGERYGKSKGDGECILTGVVPAISKVKSRPVVYPGRLYVGKCSQRRVYKYPGVHKGCVLEPP